MIVNYTSRKAPYKIKNGGLTTTNQQKVTIYSTTTCPYCEMEKQYLKQKGVEYEDVLVDRDAAKAEEMIKKSGQMGVPVTVIDTLNGRQEIIVGFDKAKLDQILGLAS